jgi:hypothetical protein
MAKRNCPWRCGRGQLRYVSSSSDRAQLLVWLAEDLPSALLPEAASLALAIPDDGERIRALNAHATAIGNVPARTARSGTRYHRQLLFPARNPRRKSRARLLALVPARAGASAGHGARQGAWTASSGTFIVKDFPVMKDLLRSSVANLTQSEKFT